jgi:iron complex transport system ATP-binding protein
MMLEIDRLTAGYGKKAVLTDISLNLPAGCICALIGRNGSGKTTLMRSINAILIPMKGSVRVADQAVDRLSRSRIARLIGMVPQNGQSAFPFSCMEMILMGAASRLRPWASPGRRERARVTAVSEMVGIRHLLGRPFQHLSGGEQRLVLLCRALYQDVKVMLLDEPNTHLDFANQHKMMDLVRRLVKQKAITALITLHDPNLALYYCDRTVMISQGTILTQGPSEEVIADATLSQVLGDNIQCDCTGRGLPVVIPKSISGKPQNERGKHALHLL